MIEVVVEAAEVSESRADLLHDLASWLAAEDDLRGNVRLVDAVNTPATLGSVAETLIATVTPAAATALTTMLVTWLRQRRGKVSVAVQAADGRRVEVSTERVAGLTAAEVRALVDELTNRIV